MPAPECAKNFSGLVVVGCVEDLVPVVNLTGWVGHGPHVEQLTRKPGQREPTQSRTKASRVRKGDDRKLDGKTGRENRGEAVQGGRKKR